MSVDTKVHYTLEMRKKHTYVPGKGWRKQWSDWYKGSYYFETLEGAKGAAIENAARQVKEMLEDSSEHAMEWRVVKVTKITEQEEVI